MAESSTEKPAVKATPEEIRNGWDDTKLQSYLAERDAQKIDFATRNAGRKNVRIENTTSFNPYRW